MSVLSGSIRPTSRHRRKAAAFAAVASLALLTGCGGTTEDAAAPASPSSAAAASPTEESAPAEAPEGESESISVTAVDFDFELDTTELAAGEYEVELLNEGGASHDLRFERDGEDVAGTEVIQPGQTATTTVTLEPGEYVIYCSVGNHREMGMEKTVTVT